MNVLNIISSTLTKQRSTYFSKEDKRSPRGMRTSVGAFHSRQFSNMNIAIIVNEVRNSLPQPDWEVVTRLSNHLFKSVSTDTKGYVATLYAALALKEWLIFQGHNSDFSAQRQDMLTLARGHLEVWLLRGVAAEQHHLVRSNELYMDYFRRFPEFSTAKDQVDHCKVLLFLGQVAEAAEIIVQVVSTHETDPNISNYLFYAGVIFKSMGDYDRASTFFFEANESGPPRFFSQIEMMTVISRNLEVMNEDGEGEDNDDAYKMVHAHLQLEGLISEETDYDDWICEASTWLSLGDKCAMHHMYSLAADFYGLAMMRDPEAFRKPMLWLRFAKACKRCGRKADSQLAIKQALSRAPYNAQLQRAQGYFDEERIARFQKLITGDLEDILNLVSVDDDPMEQMVAKLQAVMKGAVDRHDILHGVCVGGMQTLKKSNLNARVGLVVAESSLLLHAQASRGGKVKYISAFDCSSGESFRLKLDPPFLPTRESPESSPHNIILSLQVCAHSSTSQDHSGADVILQFTDWESGSYSYRRLRFSESFDNSESDSSSSAQRKITMKDVTLLGYRDFKPSTSLLSLSPMLSPRNPKSAKGTEKILISSSFLDLSAVHAADVSENILRFTTNVSNEPCVVAECAVTITNVRAVEVLRSGFLWQDTYCLVRVVNHGEVSRVSLTQIQNDRVFTFWLVREHIETAAGSFTTKRWVRLMDILEYLSMNCQSSDAEVVDGGVNELISPRQVQELQQVSSSDKNKFIEVPSSVIGKKLFCCFMPPSRGVGVNIMLMDPSLTPIVGSSLEVLDSMGSVVQHVDLESRIALASEKKISSTRSVNSRRSSRRGSSVGLSANTSRRKSSSSGERMREEERDQNIVDVLPQRAGLVLEADESVDGSDHKQLVQVVSSPLSSPDAILSQHDPLREYSESGDRLSSPQLIAEEEAEGEDLDLGLDSPVFSYTSWKEFERDADEGLADVELKAVSTALIARVFGSALHSVTYLKIEDTRRDALLRHQSSQGSALMSKSSSYYWEDDSTAQSSSKFSDSGEDERQTYLKLEYARLHVSCVHKAVMNTADIVLDELLEECVMHWMAVISDQVHGKATELARRTVDGVVRNIIQDSIESYEHDMQEKLAAAAAAAAEAAESAAAVLQSMCVDVVGMSAKLGLQNAERSIKVKKEESEKELVAKIFAEHQQKQKQLQQQQPPVSPVQEHLPPHGEVAIVNEPKKVLTSLLLTEHLIPMGVSTSEKVEFVPTPSGKNGYFVQKVRSQALSHSRSRLADEQNQEPERVEKGENTAAVRALSAHSSRASRKQRLISQRDSFTPELPKLLQKGLISIRDSDAKGEAESILASSVETSAIKNQESVSVNMLEQSEFAMPSISFSDHHEAGQQRRPMTAGAILSHNHYNTSVGIADSMIDFSTLDLPVQTQDSVNASVPYLTRAASASIHHKSSSTAVPIVSMQNARSQSPALPAASLPNYAFDTADGLKKALQNNWDRGTMPKYWETALKQRVGERINEPFSLKNTAQRQQRKRIKERLAFSAAAAAADSIIADTMLELEQYPGPLMVSEGISEFETMFYPSKSAMPYESGASFALQPSVSSETLLHHSESSLLNATRETQHGGTLQRPISSSFTTSARTHDVNYDNSHLLSTQVEPPFHNMTMRIACRSPPDHTLHFKRSTAAIAEEIDDAVEREEVDEMFRRTLKTFRSVGFVQQRPLPHAAYWLDRVSVYLASLNSIDELRKRIATLQRTSSRDLTLEETVCVLSDTNGIVGQAVEKLKLLEYYAEIRLACRSVHVRDMVLLLKDGNLVYDYKIGASSRGNTAQQSRREIPAENAALAGSVSSSQLKLSAEDLRSMSIVTDPFSAKMVEQHREVQAHRKIRKHWEEARRSGKITTAPRSQSQRQRGESVGSLKFESSKGNAASFDGADELEDSFVTAEGNASTLEQAESPILPKEIRPTSEANEHTEPISLFQAGRQPSLHQNSVYVRNRAAMITLRPATAGDAEVPNSSNSKAENSLRKSFFNSPSRANSSKLLLENHSHNRSPAHRHASISEESAAGGFGEFFEFPPNIDVGFVYEAPSEKAYPTVENTPKHGVSTPSTTPKYCVQQGAGRFYIETSSKNPALPNVRDVREGTPKRAQSIARSSFISQLQAKKPQLGARQVSINPWYLKNQQQQLQQQEQQQQQDRGGSRSSYHTENIVSEIFEQEAVGTPFAVMTRRNAERAKQDEVLARSNKQYIRRSIEMRAGAIQLPLDL